MFIEPDEITECDREISFLGRSEGVSPEFVLETRDNNRETQGIQPRIQKDKIVVERRKCFFLIRCDLFEL